MKVIEILEHPLREDQDDPRWEVLTAITLTARIEDGVTSWRSNSDATFISISCSGW